MRQSVLEWARRVLNLLPARWVCRIEYSHQSFAGLNERAVEYAFVFRQLARLCPHTVLDVGTGTTALPHLMRSCGCVVTASDNVRDYWPAGMTNRHYYVKDDDITRSSLGGKYDLITCISVLEHIQESEAAVRNMFDLLNPGGHLIITCPYTEREYCSNVYELPGSDACGRHIPFVGQSYSRAQLNKWCGCGGKVVEQEFWQFYEGEFWSVGAQVLPPRKVGAEEKHQITCLLLQKTA